MQGKIIYPSFSEPVAESPQTKRQLCFPARSSSSYIRASHVENLLGVRFPPSYKAFLLQHGALFSSVGAISGVFPQSPLAANDGAVLGDTLYYRERFQLPADFVVIERDFDDNDTWCLDL